MPTERLTFTGGEGAVLDARLELPLHDEPVACALFAHCFTCSKDLKAVVNISRALAQERIAVLRFDFTGHGESQGDFSETTFSSNVADLVAAARHLESRGQAPGILIGHSLGGPAVITAAAEIPSATAVVTIAAPADPLHLETLIRGSVSEIEASGKARVEIGGRSFLVRKSLLDDLRETKVSDAIRDLGRALLIMHSPVDGTVSIGEAAKLYTAAQHPKSFVSLPDADHLLSREEDSRYAAAVIAAWVQRYVDVQPRRTIEEMQRETWVIARTPGEGLRTEILAGGHGLVADEPRSVGGSELGPTPYDLLAAALGACTTMTLQIYARRKGWDLQEATAAVRHSRIHARDEEIAPEGAARLDRLERELELIGDLTGEQRRRLLEIAEKCPVHKTLDLGLEIATRLRDQPAPGETAG